MVVSGLLHPPSAQCESPRSRVMKATIWSLAGVLSSTFRTDDLFFVSAAMPILDLESCETNLITYCLLFVASDILLGER